jgi:hypothetical protein
MEPRILNLYLSRILSGFYIFVYQKTNYKLIYPDISIKYQAEIYAQNEYEDNKFNDWISDDDILYTLIDLGLWNREGDNNLKKLETQIEDLKVDLYKNFLNPNKIKNLKKSLNNIKKNYNKMYEIRHSLDHITPTGYSNHLKNQYILIESLHDLQDNKIFPDFNSVNYELLNSLSLLISQNSIDISIFRSIARSDLWKNYWSANKDKIFDKATTDWTDEQKTLVVLTKMYDSAYEHPECPPDSIFEDDDMFDGWMIIQKRENEKNKNKNRTEKMLDNKLNKAQEVYFMAGSKEEAQNIYSLNDINSQNIIKERNTVIFNTDKELNQDQLPDVKRDLVVENNRKFMESRKK